MSEVSLYVLRYPRTTQTEICSGSEAGSYVRLIDFCKHPPSRNVRWACEGEAMRVLDFEYRSTSLMRNSAPLGPYSGNMPWALWWPLGGGQFLMSEVPL